MIRIILLLAGFLCEYTALQALFSQQQVWIRLILFIVSHLIAAVSLALLLRLSLPRQADTKKWGSLALFFSFAFFIPVLGCIGMLGALVYFRFLLRFDARPEFFSVPMTPFMQESGGPAPGMGEGGAWSRLRSESLPRPMRLKALLAAGSSNSRDASRLLHFATSDNDDEIRLLAFNLADQREKVISKTISQSLAELKNASDRDERLLHCRKLAFSYWELIFNDLAQKDLAEFYVLQSITYATQALDMDATDPNLLLLLGRLHLWREDLESAEKAINDAMNNGAHRDRVVPYLAELAFLRRDFVTMNSCFELNPLLRHKPGIGPVAQFWMG
ncbi:hypothetical protein GeomeDRAFT_0495 [Geobacter metallireducens RCH3]|uniref:Uncharacterized protein n=1 Tax=Geobacter metallireducens (strain ATCC 53774 / DSM 7210 / GS-15) TaxID=269799 RepID=Q39U77_GEOMG|nr:hypothetical protein [Geobacter metallireducens]ABB32197.1 hypothetical protein Gmet_1968 [Geobacter metallireducens GS-15]EHP88614.1 hypothetical protein GeomeDRAFT_0495 [Geobacter metallireducens RCH3]